MGKKFDVSKEELIDLYCNKLLSPSEIGNVFGFTRKTTYVKLKEFGIYQNYFNLVNKSRDKYFTKELDEFLIGTILGDGHVELSGNGKSGRFAVRHCRKQEDYLLLKFNLFGKLVANKIRYYELILNGTALFGCEFKTISHPKFAEYKNLFYKDFVKTIKPEIKDRFTDKSLAYLVMDDGSWHRGDKIRISTDCFSYEDHLILKEILFNKFGVIMNICKGSREKLYYYTEFNKTNAIKVTNIIEPYVINSLKYKLVGGKDETDQSK